MTLLHNFSIVAIRLNLPVQKSPLMAIWKRHEMDGPVVAPAADSEGASGQIDLKFFLKQIAIYWIALIKDAARADVGTKGSRDARDSLIVQ
ncbi:hypothetical protein ABT008_30340 [Micromonospora sp. NPDC002389]|uniref:hypothetical protein n=1 Tax=Micromonospora sp. NPDC002389 TaxID=3154272 RepID=UPI003322AA43